MDDRRKLDDDVAVKDGIVRVVNVYHIKGDELCPLGVPFAEGHVQFNFSKGLDFLSTEADEGMLGLVQVLFRQPHLDEALPGDDVCRAAIIDKDATYVVPCKVHGIFADVGLDDEGVVVWVVLKPEVGFGSRDWDMGPRGAEVFAFAHMRDSAEVFFPLPLRLVYRLV